jgi:hypothetical protein
MSGATEWSRLQTFVLNVCNFSGWMTERKEWDGSASLLICRQQKEKSQGVCKKLNEFVQKVYGNKKKKVKAGAMSSCRDSYMMRAQQTATFTVDLQHLHC